jgi:phosphopantothenoylcysteine decarboxylase/phosphopantothenate--cysteine ligase
VLGGPSNTIHLVTAEGVESWPTQSKQSIADGLVSRIAAALNAAGARK